MRHFGNVVPLPERQSAAPRRVPSPGKIDTCLLSPFERAFCTIPLSAVTVAQGVMHGETLTSGEDFMLGDTFALTDSDGKLAANDHSFAPLPANTLKVDCATVQKLADFAEVLRMTLMDETGCGHLCYAVFPRNTGMRAPYILVPRMLPATRKLTLIDSVAV